MGEEREEFVFFAFAEGRSDVEGTEERLFEVREGSKVCKRR